MAGKTSGSLHKTDDKTAEGDNVSKRKKAEFNLEETIEETLKKIKNDAKGDDLKNKKLPDGFEEFVRTDGFKGFLEAMLDYNKELMGVQMTSLDIETFKKYVQKGDLLEEWQELVSTLPD